MPNTRKKIRISNMRAIMPTISAELRTFHLLGAALYRLKAGGKS
jgi:hypothetical protein